MGPFVRPLLAHVLHLHVDVAVVLVKLANLLDVLLQLGFIQAAGFIEKRNERLAFASSSVCGAASSLKCVLPSKLIRLTAPFIPSLTV